MVGCVLSQLRPSEHYILRCGNSPRPKNVELLGLYPIHMSSPRS